MSEIGELLKKIRGSDSLRKAGEKTGLSHNYISILEKGADPRSGAPIKPSPDTLKAYEKGYNYSYEELMRVAGYITDAEESTPPQDVPTKLAKYIDMELTNEEIKQKLNFKVDTIPLSDDEMDEFIAFVRAKRLMKKK